jgi:hypothetical protein
MESKKMMKKEIAFMKKKGAPKSMLKHEKAEAKGMKKGGMSGCYAEGGMVKKMAMGGMSSPAGSMKRPMMGGMGMNMGGMAGYNKGGAVRKPENPTPGDLNEIAGGDQEFVNRELMRKKAKPAAPAPKPKMYAAGGMVRADGCATKGKTRGRFV